RKRVPTKPSAAARRRRLEEKKRRSQTKRLRGRRTNARPRGETVTVVVLWDSLGTLLDVDPVRDRYPGWLEQVLHHGAALTLIGDFVPFESLAEAANPEALGLLQEELRPYPDASEALDVLAE